MLNLITHFVNDVATGIENHSTIFIIAGVIVCFALLWAKNT